MTRPEPADDRAMPPPADPWATINRPVPTVFLGNTDPTAPVGPLDRTVHLAGTNPTVPAAHHDTSAPTVRAPGEMRFGPGVPAPATAAPPWPSAAPAGRPRWRRLVSLLSSLVTLALVVVIGLYVWQQFRPLVVESATVTVPEPAGDRCDVTVDVVATVLTNGRSGTIRYQWFRSDAAPGAVLTEQVGSGQRIATLTLRWTFSGVGTTTERATVNVIEPSPVQATTPVTYRCVG